MHCLCILWFSFSLPVSPPPRPIHCSTWKSVKSKKTLVLIYTRPCIHTYNKNIKIYPRINSTVNVIRASIYIMLSVLEVTQRVPPTCTTCTTCTTKIDFTYMERRVLRFSIKYLGVPSRTVTCRLPPASYLKATSKKVAFWSDSCIQTSTNNLKTIHVRVHRVRSTVNVIRACIFIIWSVLEVTQRVPPTCTTKNDFTYIPITSVSTIVCKLYWCVSHSTELRPQSNDKSIGVPHTIGHLAFSGHFCALGIPPLQ